MGLALHKPQRQVYVPKAPTILPAPSRIIRPWQDPCRYQEPYAGVALDAVSTADIYFSAPVSAGQTAAGNITVGSGSNRVLIFTLASIFLGSLPTTNTLVWDPTGANQTMTQIFRQDNGTVMAILFGLVNPASGAKSIRYTYSADGASPGDTFLAGISFTGCDQTGGATTFYAAAGTDGTGNISQAVSSLNGDAAVCVTGSGNPSAPNKTSIYLDSTSGAIIAAAAQYALATGSTTFTWTGSGPWHTAVCAVKAGASTPVAAHPYSRVNRLLRR